MRPSGGTSVDAGATSTWRRLRPRPRDSGIIALSAALITVVFLIDLFLPLGYAGGMLYVVPVALGLWVSTPRYPTILAAITCGLTLAGMLVSSGETSTAVVLNRLGALVAIGGITIAVRRSRLDQTRLADTEDVLRGIHELASNADLDFSGATRSLLRLGCERFGLPMGMLSKVDGDTLIVVDVVAPEGTLAPGDEMALRGIPCARTVSASLPVHLDGKDTAGGFVPERYHPALPVDVYIGAPVRVGNRIYGTLAFWGKRTRATSIHGTDHEIIRLMARWVGAQIEHEEHRVALARSERQFQHAQKLEAVGRLAAGIAHDFNNLLMGMQGCVSVIRKRVGPDSPATGVLVQLREAIDRGAAITRQLLSFSRQQEGEQVWVTLDEVVRGSEDMLRPLLGEDIELDVRPGAGDLEICLGPGELDQILMNLAVNARDAMSTGDRLTIETGHVAFSSDDSSRPAGLGPGDYAVLTVTDTGSGMNAETRAKVFEPFFTTKEVGRGTGLGLSTVYAIVERVGGHIELESEVGRGTRFRILLPRAREEPPPAPTARQGPRRGSETVLVVEDEDLVRQAISGDLEPWGYELLLAASGPEALEICERRRGSIDILLTDMVLPRMRGTEIAERARGLIPGLPVIFMSAYPRQQLEREGRIGQDAVTLQKPFHVDELMGRLFELLGPGIGGNEPTPSASTGLDATASRTEPRSTTRTDETVPRAAPVQRATPGIRILFVEDDALARELSRELLEDMGYRVVTAEDGREARARFDDSIDLVITDLNLPDEKGPDLMEDFWARRPDVPAIVTSGAGPEEPSIRRVLARPRTAYVSKPVDIDDLDRVVQALTVTT